MGRAGRGGKKWDAPSRFFSFKKRIIPPSFPDWQLGALQSRDYIEECVTDVWSHQSQLCAALYSATFGQVYR